MMSKNGYKIYDESYPYFITTGVHFGLPLFSNPNAAKIILDNLQFLKEEREVLLIAYVIMENHIHFIVKGTNLRNKIGNFKSYSARKIIDLLKEQHHTRWLKRMKRVKPNFKEDQDYQFWNESFRPKQIISDKMMIQKIEYIHNNPVNRGYVDKPEHWRYSSARNYAGMESLIQVNLFQGRGQIED